MKKRIMEMLAIMSIFSVLINFIGCTGTKSENSTSDKSNVTTISMMTQEERKNYLVDEMGKKYGLICSTVSEVKKRQVSAVENEDFYYATIRNDKNELIYVWIENNGQIHDTVFSLKLKDRTDNYFQDIVSEYAKECIVSVHTEFQNIPTKEWNDNDDILQMLQTEDVYLFIKIFINNSDLASVERLAEQIASNITFCNGTLQICMCEDIKNINIENNELGDISYTKEFIKG